MGNGNKGPRLECPRWYRLRWRRATTLMMVMAGSMMAPFIGVAVISIFVPQPHDTAKALAVLVGATPIIVLIIAVEYGNRAQNRRLTTFIALARAHGGWWCCEGYDFTMRIVRADAITSALSVEPLDPMNAAHRATIQGEIDRLSGIIHELDVSARRSRTVIAELRSLIAPAPVPTAA
ncbi:hypothetical protein HY480_01520 [Candidatus Uhrbacteria bacterium]|nr:hypothetical protein [Candidatus Uhrbacteria bacterium]